MVKLLYTFYHYAKENAIISLIITSGPQTNFKYATEKTTLDKVGKIPDLHQIHLHIAHDHHKINFHGCSYFCPCNIS
jgi:hypothetical protein